ncbi:MAG: ATP-binding protein [Lachnospiraceae bacterium]|nr:ATP-binding protein [Ruminococcus sp.]MCM1274999.1 ATP-binding protein [Lachnospiraceae bacterium]
MALDKRYFDVAQKRLSNRRTANKQAEDERRMEIHRKIPKYCELECRLADTMTKIVSVVAAKAPDADEQVRAAIASNLTLQREMESLLAENGYPRDYLAPIFTCDKCKDTGTYNGGWCECFNKILNAAAAEELNSRSPLKLSSFDSFDLGLYPKTPDPALGETPYNIMRQNFAECKRFADGFNGHGYGLFMLGGTGLGKTHLSLAAANDIIQKGYCVIYGSVPELLRQLDKEQFKNADGDTMALAAECDLLILDDLGAENNTDRCTSLLYEMINARQSRSLPMIINTNLDMEQLKARYRDRLWSRLFSMKVLLFCGEDNRLKINNDK